MRKDIGSRAILLVAVMLGYAAVLGHAVQGSRIAQVATDFMASGGALLGAYWCLQATVGPGFVRRATDRRGFRVRSAAALLIGAALSCFGIGECVWSYFDLALGRHVPFPSIADGFYLAMYPLMIAGLLWMPIRRAPSEVRVRIFIDSLMTTAAVMAFGWFYVVGPLLLRGGPDELTKTLAAGYPVADLVLFFAVLLLSAYADKALAAVTGFMALAIASLVVSDLGFGLAVMHGTDTASHMTDIGWTAGAMLLGLCGRALALRSISNALIVKSSGEAGSAVLKSMEPSEQIWRSLLPYAMAPAVAFLLVHCIASHADPVVVYGVEVFSAVTVVLMLARQAMSILENARLYRLLAGSFANLEHEHNKVTLYAAHLERANTELNGLHTELAHQNRSLAQLNEKLADLATTDGMTGLANHRMFQQRIREHLGRYLSGIAPNAALLMMDVDHFKRYNDTYGHPAGDEVLCSLASILKQTVRRDDDIAARYGGEEFAVLLIETDEEGARNVADRVREAMAQTAGSHFEAVTVSVGIAHTSVLTTASAEALVASADTALYRAKRGGRNRVECAQSGDHLRSQRRRAA